MIAPTFELPPLQYRIPLTVEEMLAQGSSRLGFSTVSTYLECPERARLRFLGVRQKRTESFEFDALNELHFGTLIHTLLPTRVVSGMDAALWLLGEIRPLAEVKAPRSVDDCVPLDLHPGDQLKALTILRHYDATFPLDEEPFEYLGVEAEVGSSFKASDGRSVLRTVKYDALVRMKADGAIFSLEHKTSARKISGASYTAQMLVQQTVWNANEALVSRYGPMRGVILDVMTKTAVPSCERLGPFYFSPRQEEKMRWYLSLPERVTWPVNPNGSYPMMAHSCWGKYRPCEFINLCWEDADGDYEQVTR